MATFAELRERFSPDPNVRGKKQFEPLCKWFLETDPRYSDRLVNVWLWKDWPDRWGEEECGIDLVAKDRDGRGGQCGAALAAGLAAATPQANPCGWVGRTS